MPPAIRWCPDKPPLPFTHSPSSGIFALPTGTLEPKIRECYADMAGILQDVIIWCTVLDTFNLDLP